MNKPLITASLIVCLLSACDSAPEYDSLYQQERSALEKNTSKFRGWAEQVVTLIAENDQELERTVALVETEQDRELTQGEMDEFTNLQTRIQARSAEIARILEEGKKSQVNLFASFYRYLGKLDSGAELCNYKTIDLKNIKLSGITDHSAWPELEDAYIGAFRKGKSTLAAGEAFPCDTFVANYDALRDDVETKINEINQRLTSLGF